MTNVKDNPPVEFSSVHEPALRKIVELQKHKMELKKQADLLAQSIEELSVPFQRTVKGQTRMEGSSFQTVPFSLISRSNPSALWIPKKLQKEYPDIYKEVQKTTLAGRLRSDVTKQTAKPESDEDSLFFIKEESYAM